MHIDHHRRSWSVLYLELEVIVFSLFLLSRGWYLIGSSLVRYWIIHQLIHKTDLSVFQDLRQFHQCHHKHPTCNFGVTSLWVDHVFGTACETSILEAKEASQTEATTEKYTENKLQLSSQLLSFST